MAILSKGLENYRQIQAVGFVMKIRTPSKYTLLGSSLALMLQTNYRFVGPFGIGELLAVAFIILIIAQSMLSQRGAIIEKPDTLTIQFIAIVCLIITPMTLLSSVMNLNGSSFRDLLSYFFVCAILLVLPKSQRDVSSMVVAFLLVTFFTICAHYFFGGSKSYYHSRFTGGAKNPNQLGLYLAVAMVMLVQIPNIWVRIIIAALAIFFGVISLSDAFLAGLAVSMSVFLLLTIVPLRIAPYAIPLFLIIGYIAVVNSALFDFFNAKWAHADEGGARFQLYQSALLAWFDTPLSMIFGHGAGSFSGLGRPFEGAEAHNTFLDLATIAGIFGIFIFPLRPLIIGFESVLKKQRFAPAVLLGLIAFGLFHFVGRHPTFWVALVILERVLREKARPQKRQIPKYANNQVVGA